LPGPNPKRGKGRGVPVKKGKIRDVESTELRKDDGILFHHRRCQNIGRGLGHKLNARCKLPIENEVIGGETGDVKTQTKKIKEARTKVPPQAGCGRLRSHVWGTNKIGGISRAW